MGPVAPVFNAAKSGAALPNDTTSDKEDPLVVLAHALEMDWQESQPETSSTPWSMGKTIWFSVTVSAVLWGGVVGAMLLV